MNEDKKYYTFVIKHETLGSFPILIPSNNKCPVLYNNKGCDGYYSNEELSSIESKIFNFIKDKNTKNFYPHLDVEPCDINHTITVTQYDNEEEAKSCTDQKENWYKTYNLKKILIN